MKSDGLLKSTMLSDTRKGILYVLLEKPGSLTDLRSHFNVTSASIIPRIKDLVQANLVVKDGGDYRLTATGTILAKKLRKMDNLERVLEQAGDFLNRHDLSPIPARLLERIDELGDCTVIRNELEHITATHDRIYRQLPKTKQIMGISPALDSAYPKIYMALARHGIPVSLILTENIFRKVEKDYPGFLEEYLSYENARVSVISDARLALVTTDDFLSMYLYDTKGTFDSMSLLYSSDKSAVKWGTELFEEYLSSAREIRIK